MQNIDFLQSKPRNASILSCTGNSMEVLMQGCGGGITLEGAAHPSKNYLVGYIEILEEHSLPLMLRFFASGDKQERVYIRFVLLPKVKTLVCFELDCVDLSRGSLDRNPGMLKQVVYGTRTQRDAITQVELGIKEAYHDVRLRLEGFYLCDEKPASFPLPDKKLVDQYGQWKLKDWPGKTYSDQALKTVMRTNEGPAQYPSHSWDKWGGDRDHKLKEGTGFFTKCKTGDGRWHLVDPDGCDYFSMGVCCIRPGQWGDITGFEKQIDTSVEDAGNEQFLRIGKHPWFDKTVKHFDYGKSNLYKIYGEAWEAKWKEQAYHILMSHGINSQGNGSNLDIQNGKSKMPYVKQLSAFPSTDTIIFRDFPDVLSPQYQQNSQRCADELNAWKNDPWMIGYFLRNEPNFGFIQGVVIANEVLFNPAQTQCRIGLIHFLRERYGSIAALNLKWKADFDSFSVFEKQFENCVGKYPDSEPDLREYSVFLVREYCRIPSQACRLVDPNHLNLGMRWAKMNNPDLLAGWENFDVFSFNCYSFDLQHDMDFITDAGVDLPILVGEYHCGALDRGLPATGLKGVENQYERGVMWRMFVEQCAAHPYGVGAHWFQFQDEFCLGRFDGENYQIGLVDICMRPYPELMDAAKQTASVLYRVRNGEASPSDRKPKMIPMVG